MVLSGQEKKTASRETGTLAKARQGSEEKQMC